MGGTCLAADNLLSVITQHLSFNFTFFSQIQISLKNILSSSDVADYPALSVDRAGGGNPLYAEDTPNQEFLIWCAPIQEFLIRCTPIQEFEFTDSVLVFVRGVIWHQEGYYCYIISQMNTFIINKILPRKCLPLLTACRHL